jgi:bifunctional lysine-specific demethylase and histidyl-hydroxylase NO66
VGDVETFLAERWARVPLLLPKADRRGWADLVSPADFDQIVTSMSLRLPFFRVVKDGKEIPSASYTRTLKHRSQDASGIIDPTAVTEHYRQGATIVLESLHRYWPPLTQFCRQLEIDLGHPVQVNAYLTPAGARGFARHTDLHDVFVLQTGGRKQWMVYAPDESEEEVGTPVIDTELGEGACFYIPEGWPHAANTNDVASAHLTVGILSRSRGVLFDEVVGLAREGDLSSERLPVRLGENEELVRAMIDEEIEELRLRLDKLDRDELVHRALRRLSTTSQEVMSGQLLQTSHLDVLHDGSRVGVRDKALFRVWRMGEDVRLLLADRELRLPGFTEAALRAINDAEQLEVRDLAPHLDEASRLVLVRRLVREGLLEVLP